MRCFVDFAVSRLEKSLANDASTLGMGVAAT